jgi:hypothetical protein
MARPRPPNPRDGDIEEEPATAIIPDGACPSVEAGVTVDVEESDTTSTVG